MQEYKTTDQLLHQLSQLIAKVNQAYLPHQDDDSHTNLYYDEVGRRITGRWVTFQDNKYLLVFDLLKWEYQVLDESLTSLIRISQSGKTLDQTESEVAAFLKELGFQVEDMNKPFRYEIPVYSFLHEKINKPDSQSLESWMLVRGLANQANRLLLGYLQQEAEIRIWPHHFDTGLYVEANSQVGIGFGLAMADSMVDEPYFYLAGYALKNKVWNWEKVTELVEGEWIISEGWKGAVLPITKVNHEKPQLSGYIQSALAWFLAG